MRRWQQKARARNAAVVENGDWEVLREKANRSSLVTTMSTNVTSSVIVK